GAVYGNDGSNALFGGEAVFANNTAVFGGAICSINNSELNFAGEASVSLFNNYAGYAGGAILLYNQSDFGSYGTASLASNKAKYGGAVFVHKDSTASFGGKIVFANNTAEKNG
ncbi:unnamed protein product, partial [Ascophyllum nodosum]